MPPTMVMLSVFTYRDEPPKPTLALEYTYGRRAKGHNIVSVFLSGIAMSIDGEVMMLTLHFLSYLQSENISSCIFHSYVVLNFKCNSADMKPIQTENILAFSFVVS